MTWTALNIAALNVSLSPGASLSITLSLSLTLHSVTFLLGSCPLALTSADGSLWSFVTQLSERPITVRYYGNSNTLLSLSLPQRPEQEPDLWHRGWCLQRPAVPHVSVSTGRAPPAVIPQSQAQSLVWTVSMFELYCGLAHCVTCHQERWQTCWDEEQGGESWAHLF